MRTFAVGDIHGMKRALVQVLERANFDYDRDRLITLGDIVDWGHEVPQCIQELQKIKHHIAIRGNHDVWCMNWILSGEKNPVWRQQGGAQTIGAYVRTGLLTDVAQKQFFKDQVNYFVDEERRLYVHAGYDRRVEIDRQRPFDLWWSRSLYNSLIAHQKEGLRLPTDVNQFSDVFIGHSQTIWEFPDLKPVNVLNVYNLDQGAKQYGKLTLMQVDTKEYWQSDYTSELYRGYLRELQP